MYSKNHPPTETEVLQFHTTLSNWGRWGDDDQLGTLNLVTPEARRRGALAVRHGESVSCSWEIPAGPEGIERSTQANRYMHSSPDFAGLDIPGFHADKNWGSAAEHLAFAYHGYTFTHVDSPCHMFWDGKIYNGRPAETVDGIDGAAFASVTAAANGMVTRGVLIDIPRLHGVNWLEPGQGVFPEDLVEAELRQGVTVEPGDAVLLRTGHDRRRRETSEQGSLSGDIRQAGWHASCLPWLRDREVAYIGCDTPQDMMPSSYPTVFNPIHTTGLVAMGLWLLDNCDLYACAQTAERLNQWDFNLSVCPIRFAGTTGSPVNPIAMF